MIDGVRFAGPSRRSERRGATQSLLARRAWSSQPPQTTASPSRTTTWRTVWMMAQAFTISSRVDEAVDCAEAMHMLLHDGAQVWPQFVNSVGDWSDGISRDLHQNKWPAEQGIALQRTV